MPPRRTSTPDRARAPASPSTGCTRRRLGLRALTLAALALALAAPAALAPGAHAAEKEKDKEEERDILLDTVYDDERAGKQASEQVAEQLGLVNDAELTAYVNAIGQRLQRFAPGHDFDYVFRIVDQDAPNAFALPGGYIYISRGLLALVNNEDELANVIGHEIAHVAERHAAARQTVEGQGLFAWLSTIHVRAYGRDQERAADRVGQGLAALAGYDPAGMATFLRDLEFTERLRLGASRLPSFLDTHPLTAQRVSEADSRAQLIAWTPQPGIVSNRDAYLQKLDGLAVGIPATEGVFQGSRFIHPDLDFTLRFPDGWETHNARAAVGAIAPQRNAQVFLEVGGKGSDPEAVASRWIEEGVGQGLRVHSTQPVKLDDSLGFRLIGRISSGGRGPMHVVATWIARDEMVYQITGLASTGISKKFQGVFVSVARSFRRLTPKMRASVMETRLRIVAAQEGETFTDLGERRRNEWKPQRTAVMNDLSASATLREGQLIKIAVEEPYEPPAGSDAS